MLLPIPESQVTSFQTWLYAKKPRTGSHAKGSKEKAFDLQPVNYKNDDLYFGTALILNDLLPDNWSFLFYDDNGTTLDKGHRHFHIQEGGWSGWEWIKNGVHHSRAPGRVVQKEYLKQKFGYFRNAPINDNVDPIKTNYIKNKISDTEYKDLLAQVGKFNSDLETAYKNSVWYKLPSSSTIKETAKSAIFIPLAVAAIYLLSKNK